MRNNIVFSCLLIYLFTTVAVSADEWTWPENAVYKSSSGNFVFKVFPDKNLQHGRCLGILNKVNGNKQKEIWSRCLINNDAPVNVFVSDSGKYVVTMDEWGEVGKFPLVIYGNNGSLIAVHSTDSLGLKDDSLNIKMTISSYWWSEDSISFFGPEDKLFFIRLHWEKILTVNLSNGKLCDMNYIDSNDQLRGYVDDKIRNIAIAKLNSKLPEERSTGALIVGQLRIKEAIPRLKELLEDTSSYEQKSGDAPLQTVYYIRKRAREALEQMGVTVKGIVTEEKAKQPNSLW